MTKVEALERIRVAKAHLQPIQDGLRGRDAEINRILNQLTQFEARVQYGSRNGRD